MRSGRQLLGQANQTSWRTLGFFAGFGRLCAAQWLNKRYLLDIAYADNAFNVILVYQFGGDIGPPHG